MEQDRTQISALRSVAHPVRLRILSLLTAEAMSAAEVARTLDLTHANASYHLRVLHEAGELEVDSEEKIRGGVAKRYRYVVGREPAGPPAEPEDLMAYVHATSREVKRRLVRRRRGRGHLGDIETAVTPEVWAEAVEQFNAALSLLHTHARPLDEPGTVHVSASAFAFEMEPAPRRDER